MTGHAGNHVLPVIAALLFGVAIVVGIFVAQRIQVGTGTAQAQPSEAELIQQALRDQRADEKVGLSSYWAYGGASSHVGPWTQQDVSAPKATWVTGDPHQEFLDAQKGLAPTRMTTDYEKALANELRSQQMLAAERAGATIAAPTFTSSDIERALAAQRAGEKEPLFPKSDPDVRRGGYLIR
jgi:hypothetical protein